MSLLRWVGLVSTAGRSISQLEQFWCCMSHGIIWLKTKFMGVTKLCPYLGNNAVHVGVMPVGNDSKCISPEEGALLLHMHYFKRFINFTVHNTHLHNVSSNVRAYAPE